ncbi:MAG: glycine cleavage system protein T [Proteobacteria bacterium]|nr:MAG: glycine cleavage system protein T [Pseudomonadota bacterium]
MSTSLSPETKNTPLLALHREAGARIVDFAGFAMPLQYSGIVDEHHAVRKAAGLFDVSHMGEVDFFGPGALLAVDRLVTNNVLGLEDGQALYSPICRPNGGIVDDCLVYRFGDEHLRIVVNASTTDKDVAWFRDNTGERCKVEDRSAEFGLIALQGPRAEAIWRAVAGDAAASIGSFRLADCDAGGVSCTTARTGYTGEDGFEIFCAAADAPALWSALVAAGAPEGLKPCGLGARDTLRLEARLPLYGNDINDETTPLEAGLSWTVKLKAGEFIGKEALVAQKKAGVKRKLVCLEMRAKGIARQGYPLRLPADDGSLGERVGEVTSGTKSPTLEKAIALGYVPKALAKIGTALCVEIRGKAVPCEVVKGPFYHRPVQE